MVAFCASPAIAIEINRNIYRYLSKYVIRREGGLWKNKHKPCSMLFVEMLSRIQNFCIDSDIEFVW